VYDSRTFRTRGYFDLRNPLISLDEEGLSQAGIVDPPLTGLQWDLDQEREPLNCRWCKRYEPIPWGWLFYLDNNERVCNGRL